MEIRVFSYATTKSQMIHLEAHALTLITQGIPGIIISDRSTVVIKRLVDDGFPVYTHRRFKSIVIPNDTVVLLDSTSFDHWQYAKQRAYTNRIECNLLKYR